MMRERHGALFTIMAIAIVALLFSLQRSTDAASTVSAMESAAAQSRVTAMDAYIVTFEEYTKQALASSGYFALTNASRKIRADQAFLSDVNATVSDCVLNNHIVMGGIDRECLAASQDFRTAMTHIIILARTNLSVTTTYTVHQVWLTEERPFEVVLWANVSYQVTDAFATWRVYNKVLRTDIDVSGMQDPVYAYLNGSGFTREQRVFSLTPLKLGQFNPTVFSEFYNNGSYIISEGRAPSVLQRYAGATNRNSSCCGIESVMVRANLVGADTNTSYVNLSMADHHFSANKQGLMPLWRCDTQDVRAISIAGKRLVLESGLFTNRYNLTASEALPACAWP